MNIYIEFIELFKQNNKNVLTQKNCKRIYKMLFYVSQLKFLFFSLHCNYKNNMSKVCKSTKMSSIVVVE